MAFASWGGRSKGEIVVAGDDFASGFLLELFAGVAGNGPALTGGVFVFGKAPGVAAAGDLTRAPSARLALTGPTSAGSTPNASVPVFSRGCLAKHGENELKVGHVVAQVLAVQFLVACVFGRSETEGGLGDLTRAPPARLALPGPADCGIYPERKCSGVPR